MKFDLLKSSQIFGNENIIFEKYGKKALLTDFSILLGSYISSGDRFNIEDGTTGWWWAKGFTTHVVISALGNYKIVSPECRDMGVRPTISYSDIKSNCLESDSNSNIKEVLYGEYPQTIVDNDTSIELNKLYNSGSLKSTGKSYTTDSTYIHDFNQEFQPMTHTECEYNGNKYIRVIADNNSKDKTLSNGEKIELGHPYWIKVEPISWLVDEKNNIALSKKILVSGIQYINSLENDSTIYFKDTNLGKFLNKYFKKDIIPSKISKEKTKSKKQLLNEYKKLLELKRSLIEQTEKTDSEIELVRLKLILSKNSK